MGRQPGRQNRSARLRGSGVAIQLCWIRLGTGGDEDFMPENGVFDQVEIFGLSSRNWETVASMPVAGSNSECAQLCHYLCVAGGWRENSPAENVNVAQRCDVFVDNWVIGPDFTSARADFALAATTSGLYAAGGDDTGNFFFDATDTLEHLDVSGFPGGERLPVSDPSLLNGLRIMLVCARLVVGF